MGLRFRSNLKIFPGVRLNISKSGISTSIGVPGATLNLGPRGIYGTLGIPGTGISYRQRIGVPHQDNNQIPTLSPPLSPPRAPKAPLVPQPLTEIRSRPTDEITSIGLKDFKKLLADAYAQQCHLNAQLPGVQASVSSTTEKARKWQNGLLLRHILRSRFRSIQSAAAEASQELEELEGAIKSSRLPLEVATDSEIATTYEQMMDKFRALAASECCWDTTAQRSTDRKVERTIAFSTISRMAVLLQCLGSDVIDSTCLAMKWQNANGGDIFIYPGFLLLLNAPTDFAVIDLREIRLEYSESKFVESERVPSDSQLVGHTWAKVNKDGSPDRRFANNPQLPILLYGELKFFSAAGLNEKYMFSNAGKAKAFKEAFSKHQLSLQTQLSDGERI
jgi:hypothetical protein